LTKAAEVDESTPPDIATTTFDFSGPLGKSRLILGIIPFLLFFFLIEQYSLIFQSIYVKEQKVYFMLNRL
jgi:hypothetical protein